MLQTTNEGMCKLLYDVQIYTTVCGPDCPKMHNRD